MGFLSCFFFNFRPTFSNPLSYGSPLVRQEFVVGVVASFHFCIHLQKLLYLLLPNLLIISCLLVHLINRLLSFLLFRLQCLFFVLIYNSSHFKVASISALFFPVLRPLQGPFDFFSDFSPSLFSFQRRDMSREDLIQTKKVLSVFV